MKDRKPKEICDLIAGELSETLFDHLEFHAASFESVFISFRLDGTWMLSGFGGDALSSLNTIATVLAEASEYINSKGETMH